MKTNYIKANQQLWDDKTKVHLNSKFYDVEGFYNGKNSLHRVELSLLKDVSHQKILHLQCHFGLDSMSLTRLGAEVTGVDLSGVAIKEAKRIAKENNLDTKFIQSDVFELREKLEDKFDIIYTSYGVLGWLPDMLKWAEIVQHFLKPNGKLILVEFHPFIWMMSYDFKKIHYEYDSTEPIIELTEGTYADKHANIANTSVSWNHGLAKVMSSLIDKNLKITHIEEYDFSPYDCFQNTIKIKENTYQIKGLEGKIPMLYSLVAEKEL